MSNPLSATVVPELKLPDNFESYENIADLKNNTALLHGLKNCYVLIKGSRGIQLEQLLSAL